MSLQHVRYSVLIALLSLLLPTPAEAEADRAVALTTTYRFPAAKQGVTDWIYQPSVPLGRRYDALAKLGIGLKTYNYFWGGVEGSVAASTAPLRCPGGTMMVPGSEAERRAQGYHKYHCYNSGQVSMFDAMLALDQKHGLQSVAIIWNTPPMYRVPGCQGFDNGGQREYGGCVPNDGAMDEYEDFINFLASRYNGGAVGKLSHFIIWNEVASSAWFDYSPTVDTSRPVNDGSARARWLDKYVDMLSRSRRAVDRHSRDALVEISLDYIFNSDGIYGGKAHIGGKAILDGIWSRVGTSFDWSVAIHPYGDPADADHGPGIFNFFGLRYLTQYQQQQLSARGVRQPLQAPQSWLIASEQGWFDIPLDSRALNMCKAHNIIVSMPNVIGATHNYLQASDASGDGLGLIPAAAGQLFERGPQYPTYLAYVSTGPDFWGKRDDHYCCQRAHLGCKVAGQDTTSPPLNFNVPYKLINPQSGLCLSVPARAGNGTPLQLMRCDQSDAQRLTVRGASNSPNFSLEIKSGGGCVDIAGASTAAGATVQRWDCTGAANQKYRLVPQGGNTFAMKMDYSGKCIDVPGGSTREGTGLQQYDCNESAAQRWVPLESTFDQGTFEISNASTHQCVDVAGYGKANGTLIQQWGCTGATNQLYRFVFAGIDGTGGGYYNIVAQQAGKCLDVQGVSKAAGAPLWLWDCMGAAQTNQQWRVERQADGSYRLGARHSGLMVDLKDGLAAPGTPIRQWPDNGMFGQRWRLTPHS
ncbi:MAG: hypothetical protein EOO38_01165 [Cytophagaceae bacterium]|nr:MAG: hypothetical protein EOO38_01165 [Cytophagaceae bacterium]